MAPATANYCTHKTLVVLLTSLLDAHHPCAFSLNNFLTTLTSLRFVCSQTVTVIVGEERRHFVFFRYILEQESEYFRTALSGPWQESASRTFELKEENAAVVTLFAAWLYCKKLIFTIEFDTDAFLVQSYLLGDRRGAPNFQNAVIDALNARWVNSEWKEPKLIMTVFDETAPSTKLRKLLADKWAWSVKPGERKSIIETSRAIREEFETALCKAFLARLDDHDQDITKFYRCSICSHTGLVTFAKMDFSMPAELHKAPWLSDFCANYHEHAADEKCMKIPAMSSSTSQPKTDNNSTDDALLGAFFTGAVVAGACMLFVMWLTG